MKRLLLKLSLSASAVLVTLVAAEFICRLIFPSWAPVSADRLFWVYDSELGWFHRPNTDGYFRHPEFSIHVSNNDQGLRDSPYPLARQEGKKRILVLGDSFGWGYGVEHDQRFSEVIEGGHQEWEVINASVSGFGTDQEYLLLKRLGLDYAPDIVMLMFYENDLINNLHTVQYWHSKPRFILRDRNLVLVNSPVPPPSVKQRIGKFILGRTYLYAKLYRSLKGSKGDAKQADASADPGTLTEKTAVGSNATESIEEAKRPATSPQKKVEGLEITSAILERMSLDLKDAGIDFLVVVIPMFDETRKTLIGEMELRGIPYLDLTPAFEGHQKDVTFPTDCHWTPYGHRVAAEAIGKKLTGLLNR